jgi:serine/tyrosine/threonine adenylyltransferase
MDEQAEAAEFCKFDNSYARLPDRFFTRLQPTPVAAPRLVRLNTKLALDLGLNPERLVTPEGVEMLAGNLVPQGGEPLAMTYAGHQFGTFVPRHRELRVTPIDRSRDRCPLRLSDNELGVLGK